MALTNIRFNLKRLDPKTTTVTGRNYSVEDRLTGQVYISRKEYINKLFEEMGYRSLNVINILEEFAGKIISEVGSLRSSSLWVDEITDSFIVCSETAKDNFNRLFEEFDTQGYTILAEHKADPYKYWDEYTIVSPKGIKFVLYISLYWETVSVLTIHDTDGVIDGVLNEGEWKLNDAAFIRDIFVTLNANINASVGIIPRQEMSLNEYVTLLCTLGYLKIKRGGKCYLTEEGEQLQDIVADFINISDEYNLSNDLKRRITPAGVTFREAYELISNSPDTTVWSVREFYINNSNGKSDLMLIE